MLFARLTFSTPLNCRTFYTYYLNSYWVGSQNTGQPIYQYRMILPFDDDKMINVATDLDMNLEGELKAGITPNISVKSNFQVKE